MPYVSIRVAGKLSIEQKEKMCAGVTDVIAECRRQTKGEHSYFY